MLRIIAAAFAVFLATSVSAQQTLNVPSASYPTIQSAINAAAAGDTVLIASGIYGGGLVCTKAITIAGAGMGNTIIDSNLLSVGLAVTLPAAETLVVKDLTLRRGTGCITHGTIPSIQTSTLRLEQVRISLGRATYGSGINAAPHTQLDLVSCEFLNNGVPFNSPSTISTDGGAIHSQGHVTAVDCLFEGNSAHPFPLQGQFSSGGVGAGVLMQLGGTGYFERCQFKNNIARSSTCIHTTSFIAEVGALEVIDCVFENNSSTVGVAGISKSGGVAGNHVRIENSLFHGNSSGSGINKLLFILVDTAEIIGCTFAANDASNNASALAQISTQTSLKIRNSVFSNNGTDHLNLSLAPGTIGQFSHNLSSSSTFAGIGTAQNNIEGIPAGFRSLATKDFRLLPSSAAVNAGTTVVLDATTDLDGLPRSQLGAPDMGCYELQPGEEDPGAVWAGTVPDLMGGFEDVLLVNGIAGGVGRSVNLAIGTTTTIAVDAAPGTLSSNFIIWGRIGLPGAIEVFPIPFAQGSMAFVPHLLDLGNPSLFTFASSSLPGGIFAAPPAPWSVTGSSLPFPLTITLQGLIETGNSNVRLTNAIVVHNF